MFVTGLELEGMALLQNHFSIQPIPQLWSCAEICNHFHLLQDVKFGYCDRIRIFMREL